MLIMQDLGGHLFGRRGFATLGHDMLESTKFVLDTVILAMCVLLIAITCSISGICVIVILTTIVYIELVVIIYILSNLVSLMNKPKKGIVCSVGLILAVVGLFA